MSIAPLEQKRGLSLQHAVVIGCVGFRFSERQTNIATLTVLNTNAADWDDIAALIVNVPYKIGIGDYRRLR